MRLPSGDPITRPSSHYSGLFFDLCAWFWGLRVPLRLTTSWQSSTCHRLSVLVTCSCLHWNTDLLNYRQDTWPLTSFALCVSLRPLTTFQPWLVRMISLSGSAREGRLPSGGARLVLWLL